MIAVRCRFSSAMKLANSCGDRNAASAPRFLSLLIISSNFNPELISPSYLIVGAVCERQRGQITRHNRQGIGALCKTLISLV